MVSTAKGRMARGRYILLEGVSMKKFHLINVEKIIHLCFYKKTIFVIQ